MLPQNDGAESTVLGLADVALGGWVLGFALRVDYMKAGSFRNGYFALVLVGYSLGLAAALSSSSDAINQFRPSLVFVNPLTLLPFIFLAW